MLGAAAPFQVVELDSRALEQEYLHGNNAVRVSNIKSIPAFTRGADLTWYNKYIHGLVGKEIRCPSLSLLLILYKHRARES